MRVTVSLVVALAVWTASAYAQAPVTDSRRNAVVQAIERAAPAVVSVNVVVRQNARMMVGDFWDLFAPPRPVVRKINTIGSGFFFDSAGHVITNYHVVADASEVASVTLPDGRELPATLVGADRRTDIAVLQVKGDGLPVLPSGDSEDLMIGEWVIAIGNPFGTLMGDPQPSVSVGVVSALHRRVSPRVADGERLYQGMIQTDAAINPGNSGGPLVNAQGKAVGVNTMIFSQSGGSVGLGFAIPINRARRVAEEIIQYGRRRDPWAGFKVEDIEALRVDPRGQRLLSELGVAVESGCLVVNILKASPAFAAGLRPGDVITSVNRRPVRSASDIDFVVWDMFVGDQLAIEANRNGKVFTCTFAIQELAQE